MIYLFEQMFNT